MRFEEVQDHRIADDELAVDRLRMAGKSFGQDVQIDIGGGRDDGEAHEIFSAASRASGNLLDFADRQIGEVPRLADAGLSDDDRAGREIDSGGQGGRGKDGIQAAMRINSSTAIFQDGRCPA